MVNHTGLSSQFGGEVLKSNQIRYCVLWLLPGVASAKLRGQRKAARKNDIQAETLRMRKSQMQGEDMGE